MPNPIPRTTHAFRLPLGAGLALAALAALLWIAPAAAQEHGQAPPAPPGAGQHGRGAEGSQPPPGTAHEQAPGTARGGEKHEAGEPAGHGEEKHEAGEAAGHGEEGGEGEEFSIHIGTWITGLLKQVWYRGPATLTADGVIGAEPEEVRGKKVEFVFHDHHSKIRPAPEYVVHPVVAQVGEQKEAMPGVETAEAKLDGRTITLINPAVKFAYEGMFPEALVISILTALFLAILAVALTRNLQRIPGKTQTVLELIYTGFDNFVHGLIGPTYKRYVPLIATSFIYILCLNLAGLIPGWASPTANINITLALALVIMVYVHYEGLRVNGLVGYLKHYVGEPWWLFWLNIPIHLIGELARVLSLSVRLFGNLFGEDVVIVILLLLAVKFTKGLVPVHSIMYFLGAFTSLVQALVFSLLACIYIALWTTHEEGEHGGHEHHGHHEEEAKYPERTPAPAV